MGTGPTEPPDLATDSRTETVSARLTAAQRREVILVAALNECTITALLWDYSIRDILARAQRIRETHSTAATAV